MANSLVLSTYNATGIKSNVKKQYINKCLLDNRTDILLLQETWLLDSQQTILSGINSKYLYTATSGVSSRNDVIRGRPAGGVAILWRHEISKYIKVVPTVNKRICCIKICLPQFEFLVVCCYMPCDTQTQKVDEELIDTLNAICCLIESSDSKHCIIGGDFNIDFVRNTGNVKYMKGFMNDYKLHLMWDSLHVRQDYTFESYDGKCRSTIDHFLSSYSINRNIVNCWVSHDVENLSSHSPVSIQLEITNLNKESCPRNLKIGDSVCWERASDKDLYKYKMVLDNKLESLNVHVKTLYCKNNMCISKDHRGLITLFYKEFVTCLIEAADSTIPKRRPKKYQKPFWNSIAEPEREKAMFWHSMWCNAGRPRNGIIANIRRSTRAKYHKAVRDLCRNEHYLRMKCMANNIYKDKSRNLWTEIKRLKPPVGMWRPLLMGVHNQRILLIFLR